MVRRISTSQLRSKLRQAQQKQRQAINKINQSVRQYNQAVRTHNARVRANRQRLRNELAKLNRQPKTSVHYVVYRTSVVTLHEAYTRLEHRAETQQLDPMYNRVLDLSERETANSLEVMNRLLGTEAVQEEGDGSIEDAALIEELRGISEDLDDRWRGAVFALNPRNPDAARHFCTSAREIITQILEIKAPDVEVFRLLPNCDRTERGNPTRRAKIKYFLHRKGMTEDTLEEFVEEDIENIVRLFNVFNSGTHGTAGTFNFQQLAAIRKRVQEGILFLTEVIGDA